MPYGWTETTAVFLRTDTNPVDAARYAAAACILRLGLAVAQADGRVQEDELRRLIDHIDGAFDLSATERRRLEALRSVLLQVRLGSECHRQTRGARCAPQGPRGRGEASWSPSPPRTGLWMSANPRRSGDAIAPWASR
jgi:hypothetical protein